MGHMNNFGENMMTNTLLVNSACGNFKTIHTLLTYQLILAQPNLTSTSTKDKYKIRFNLKTRYDISDKQRLVYTIRVTQVS